MILDQLVGPLGRGEAVETLLAHPDAFPKVVASGMYDGSGAGHLIAGPSLKKKQGRVEYLVEAGYQQVAAGALNIGSHAIDSARGLIYAQIEAVAGMAELLLEAMGRVPRELFVPDELLIERGVDFDNNIDGIERASITW